MLRISSNGVSRLFTTFQSVSKKRERIEIMIIYLVMCHSMYGVGGKLVLAMP